MSFTAGQTGGEYKHKLIVDELASHSHKTTYKYGTELSATNGGGSGWTHFTCNNDSNEVNAAGGDKPHNNIQPYIATNIWRRVS